MLLALGGSADALLAVPRASPRMAATTDWSSDEPWHATSTASSTPSKAAFEQAFAPVRLLLSPGRVRRQEPSSCTGSARFC